MTPYGIANLLTNVIDRVPFREDRFSNRASGIPALRSVSHFKDQFRHLDLTITQLSALSNRILAPFACWGNPSISPKASIVGRSS